MKTQIKNYIFNKTLKTVVFTDYQSIDLDSILLITNVTSNIIIYNFALIGLGGTVLDNVLTLNYDTSTMANTDKLQIFYDDKSISHSTEETLKSGFETSSEEAILLRRLVKLLDSNATVDISNRQKVVVDAGITISSGTVSTVLNLATIAGIDPRFTMIEQAKINYNTGVRSNLSFT